MTAAILASEGGTFGFPILPALVFVPMLGALLIAVLPAVAARARPPGRHRSPPSWPAS